MFKRWKLVAVSLLLVGLFILKQNEQIPYREEVITFIQEPIDLYEVRQLFNQWTKNEKILVHYSPQFVNAITSVEQEGNGFYVTVSEPMPTLYAKESGLVYFTGYLKEKGAALRVKYDDGKDVTYSSLTDLHVLPYSVLQMNDKLATISGQRFYIEVKEAGQFMTEDQLVRWLNNE